MVKGCAPAMQGWGIENLFFDSAHFIHMHRALTCVFHFYLPLFASLDFSLPWFELILISGFPYSSLPRFRLALDFSTILLLFAYCLVYSGTFLPLLLLFSSSEHAVSSLEIYSGHIFAFSLVPFTYSGIILAHSTSHSRFIQGTFLPSL